MGQNTFEVTDQNFNTEVIASKEPVLVDFWAEWCQPCKMIAPSLEAIGAEQTGKLRVGKLNVDDNPNVAGQFGIRSIPTLLLFKGGKPVDQLVGAVSKSKIEEMIARHAG